MSKVSPHYGYTEKYLTVEIVTRIYLLLEALSS